MKIPFAIALLLIVSCPPGQSQTLDAAKTKTVETPSGTVSWAIIPPNFKTTTLKDRVAEAMQHAKKYDLSFINYLMDLHQRDPDTLLDLIEPYVKDEDASVHTGVIEAAGRARTLKAFNILTALVDDAERGNVAAARLYSGYTRQELLERGGTRLRGALFRSTIANHYSTDSVLLLSLYKNDPKTIGLLERRRKSFRTITPGIKVINPSAEADASDIMFARICLDLSLTELGKADATQRIIRRFESKDIQEILGVVGYLKFVDNKSILLQSVELLKDKRRIYQGTAPAGADSIIPKVRVCDKALSFLADRADIPLGVEVFSGKIYSDTELTQAYQRIKTFFLAETK